MVGRGKVIKNNCVTIGSKRRIPTLATEPRTGEASKPVVHVNRGEDELIKDIKINCSCGEEIIVTFEYDTPETSR